MKGFGRSVIRNATRVIMLKDGIGVVYYDGYGRKRVRRRRKRRRRRRRKRKRKDRSKLLRNDTRNRRNITSSSSNSTSSSSSEDDEYSSSSSYTPIPAPPPSHSTKSKTSTTIFLVSYVVSYMVSIAWQHVINRALVESLRTQTFCPALVQAYVVYSLSLCGVIAMSLVLVTQLHISPQAAAILLIAPSGILNYFCLKLNPCGDCADSVTQTSCCGRCMLMFGDPDKVFSNYQFNTDYSLTPASSPSNANGSSMEMKENRWNKCQWNE